MSESWTPGPWTVESKRRFSKAQQAHLASLGRDAGSAAALQLEPDGDVTCRVITADGSKLFGAFSEADARLVAAAPEMAQVLGEIAEMHQDDCPAYEQEGPCECLSGFARELLVRIRGEA